eukprot:jgi/Bigna1/140225/aug1.55_g14933
MEVLRTSGIFEKLRESSRSFENIPEDSRIFQNLREHSGSFENLPENSREFWKIRESSRMRRNPMRTCTQRKSQVIIRIQTHTRPRVDFGTSTAQSRAQKPSSCRKPAERVHFRAKVRAKVMESGEGIGIVIQGFLLGHDQSDDQSDGRSEGQSEGNWSPKSTRAFLRAKARTMVTKSGEGIKSGLG